MVDTWKGELLYGIVEIQLLHLFAGVGDPSTSSHGLGNWHNLSQTKDKQSFNKFSIILYPFMNFNSFS